MQNENINKRKMLLELGDIIQIIAPNNSEIHNHNFYIDYIDNLKIKAISISNVSTYIFNFNENGELSDESIESINLLSRSSETGFVKQNKLEKGIWIILDIGGDYPQKITGEITNTEEDMIEITTHPDLDTVFIDFAYKGIPENLPLNSITITSKPSVLKNIESLSLVKTEMENGNIHEIPTQELATTEMLDNGESIINIPEETSYDNIVIEDLQKLYSESNNLIFGKKLDPVKQYIEVPENEQRYDINTQVNDIIDEFFSNVPIYKRTPEIKKHIHNLITKFVELREEYSKFDSNNTIYDINLKTAFYKPLVKSYENLNCNLKWIMPVVATTKNIYVPNEFMQSNDTVYNEQNGLEDLINLDNKYYKQKQSNITYKYLLNTIHNSFKPVNAPNDLNGIIFNSEINDDFTSLVDNLPNFKSTTVHKEKLRLQSFVFQKYIKGEDYLKETYSNNKLSLNRCQATPNEIMYIKSFIFLPKPVIDYSKITLKTSNILNKSILNLNHFYNFRYFKNKLSININNIKDLDKEINYKTYKSLSENDIDLLKISNYFSLENDYQGVDNIDYSRFLESIFPKTMNILKIYRKNLDAHFSQKSIIDELEPFLIYNDDLTYQQYKEIRFIVKENISKLKIKISNTSVLFNKILTRINKIDNKYENTILSLLKTDKELNDQMIENYNITEHMSNSETLNKIYNSDNSLLLNAMLSSHMNVLNTPKSLIDILEKTNIENMDEDNKYTDDCFKRYISNKYISVDDLQKDNNNDIFFDTELDDTPYHLLDNYETEYKNMSTEDFLDFLKINLIEKHGFDEENAKETSNILVNKQRPVENGHYAMLELSPNLIDQSLLNEPNMKESIETEKNAKMKRIYYKRIKNIWVKDDSLDDISFIDTNDLFCNISDNCFKNTKKNVCETEDASKLRFRHELKNKLLNEFDKRYTINADELQNQNLKRINYYSNMLSLKNILDDVKINKQNNISFLLGTYANNDPIIKSPNLDKLHKILSDNDFVKKQHNIIKFVNYYTRPAIVKEIEECPYWLYCKETNTKLLPKFLHDLAISFVENNNYYETLNLIISNQGEEEGDFIVDRYSSWKISNIEMAEQDMYDSNGRKIISHDILVDKLNISTTIKIKTPKIFENIETEKIYNVFSTLCDNLNIVEEKIDDLVMHLSNETVNNQIMSQEKYEKNIKLIKEKKGKDSPPYDQYYNETLVIIVASILLVSVQVAIPSITTKITFPGCKKSFSGYPFTGVEDITGIKYIACTINKIKSTIKPWDSINKYNENIIMNRIKQTIDKVLLKKSEINELILKKKEYLILNPEKRIDNTVGIKRWVEFLPPLVDIKLHKSITNVSPEFKKEIYKNMLKGREQQFDMYHTLLSKNHKITLSIINTINGIIKKMPILLKTSSSIPYLDNACCNELEDKMIPMDYFIDKEDSIKSSIKAINKNSEMIRDIVALSKGPLLFYNDSIKNELEIETKNFSEINIYHTFIHFCKYDTIYDVPLKYKNICGEKPEGYNKDAPIEEKIVFLKKNDRKFSQESLKNLLNIINKNNIHVYNNNLEYSFLDPLKDIVNSFDNNNSNIFEQPLRKQLLNILSSYKKDKFYESPSDNLNKLKRYLYKTNNNFLIQIMDFLSKYGDLDDRKYEKYKNHLFNITYWDIDTNNNSYFDNGIHNISKFIENMVYNYSKYYPSLILNGKINNTVNNNWNLSDKHNKDIKQIIDDYYKKLSTFINDKSLSLLITNVSNSLNDINIFIKHLPVLTPFKINDKNFHTLLDKETHYHLLKYCLYSCYYEYIMFTDNDEIFNLNLEYNKNELRNINNNDDTIIPTSIIDDERDIEDPMGSMNEIKISKSNIIDIKVKVANLLIAYLEMEIDDKNNIDYSYENTYSNVKKLKNLEKNNIVEKLGAMQQEDRDVETLLKKYRLEKWNLANQKGFTTYDKDSYDNDTMRDIFKDTNNDPHFEINNEGINGEMDDEIDQEGRNYDINDLDENFTDGVFYSEDKDEDFFED